MGTVSDFFLKKIKSKDFFFRGKGVRDATVSDFFVLFWFCFVFFMLGGERWWVRGAIVREFL